MAGRWGDEGRRKPPRRGVRLAASPHGSTAPRTEKPQGGAPDGNASCVEPRGASRRSPEMGRAGSISGSAVRRSTAVATSVAGGRRKNPARLAARGNDQPRPEKFHDTGIITARAGARQTQPRPRQFRAPPEIRRPRPGGHGGQPPRKPCAAGANAHDVRHRLARLPRTAVPAPPRLRDAENPLQQPSAAHGQDGNGARPAGCAGQSLQGAEKPPGRRIGEYAMRNADRAMRGALPYPALRLVNLGARFARAGAADALDRAARQAGLLRDLGVLFFDDTPGGRVALEAAERRARHPAVGALRAVLVHHVEENEIADDPRAWLARHVALPCCGVGRYAGAVCPNSRKNATAAGADVGQPDVIPGRRQSAGAGIRKLVRCLRPDTGSAAHSAWTTRAEHGLWGAPGIWDETLCVHPDSGFAAQSTWTTRVNAYAAHPGMTMQRCSIRFCRLRDRHRLVAPHVGECLLQVLDLRRVVEDDVGLRGMPDRVILVIGLGREERRIHRAGPGDDRALPRLRRIELRDVVPRDLRLRLALRENLRAVLRARVRSLAVELRRVVRDREEDLQNLAVGHLLRIEGHLHSLGVTGAAGAHRLVDG